MQTAAPTGIAGFLHRLTLAGAIASLGVLALSMFVTIVLRSVFSTGSILLQDVGAYAFAACVALAIPAATGASRHVRVGADPSREGAREAKRQTLRNMAALFLVAPVFLFAAWHAFPGISYGWQVGERSPQAGGLPFYWGVRALLPLSLVLTVVQLLAGLRREGEA